MNTVTAYVDGSSRGNPGPSGWAYVLMCTDSKGCVHTREDSGSVELSTNNVMELTALWQAVLAIKKPCTLHVVTDSKNVVGWMTPIEKGGFKRKLIHIRQICEEIDFLVKDAGITLEFEWVKGHAGHPHNELVNQLAQACANISGIGN